MREKKTTSIAMTTYNGEKYIRKQLLSLVGQSVLPDEIVVIDDKSNDSTIFELKKFQQEYMDLFKINIIENKTNLGYNLNFLKAASYCNCDIIFFADQDDIWHEQKIEKFLNIFDQYEDLEAVSSSFSLIDERDLRIKKFFSSNKFLFENNGFIKFSSQVRNFYSSGMTLAVKNTSYEQLRKVIEKDNLFFDTFAGLFFSLRGTFFKIKDELTYHRIHLNNTSAPVNNVKDYFSKKDRIILSRQSRVKHLKSLIIHYADMLDLEEEYLLKNEVSNLMRSIELVEAFRYIDFFNIIKNLNKFSNKKLYFQLLLFKILT